MTIGFSDRIAHALAFAAKHGHPRPMTGGAGTWPTAPANVAVILSRHGVEEPGIVAGILRPVVNDAEAGRQRELLAKVEAKFGVRVGQVLAQVLEPRFDNRGKPRGWEASRMELLAGLTGAEPCALEVLAAQEIYACGALLTDVRRLGPEYLSSYAPGGAPTLRWWFGAVVDVLARHPVGPRPPLLAELRGLSERLIDSLD